MFQCLRIGRCAAGDLFLFFAIFALSDVSGGKKGSAWRHAIDTIVAPKDILYTARMEQEARDSAERREEMFPGWGECRYDTERPGGLAQPLSDAGGGGILNNSTTSSRTPSSHRRRRKDLLVINALGDSLVRLYNVERNIVRHFTTGRYGEWDCLAMVYGELSNSDLSCLMQLCEIERAHDQWGEFLATLTPITTKHYEHVVVLLDDIFIPDAYDVDKDLSAMDLNGVDVFQPAVTGATNPGSRGQAKKCLYTAASSATFPNYLEFFFTFFTSNAWSCFYHSVIEKRVHNKNNDGNPGGCGFDVCFPVLCPHLKFGMEGRSDVYHIEAFETSRPFSERVVNASGFGKTPLMAHLSAFTSKTKNPCDWRISPGNCSATILLKPLKHATLVPIDCTT